MVEKQEIKEPEIIKGNLLEGKCGLILGVANERSIAWNIAKSLNAQGAKLAFSYQGEKLAKRIKPLAESVNSDLVFECDVTDEKSVERLFTELKSKWGKLDFLVHSIAFADKDELKGRFIETSKENFLNSMNISCYSIVTLSRHAEKLMTDGGKILTLTYFGSNRVIPNYNVMGIAKSALEASVRYLAEDLGKQNININAISAGPIKTLAASGIGDFNYMLKWTKTNAPLRKNVSGRDVGNSAVYFLSELSSGVTGEIHYVDSGYNIMGMRTSDSHEIE